MFYVCRAKNIFKQKLDTDIAPLIAHRSSLIAHRSSLIAHRERLRLFTRCQQAAIFQRFPASRFTLADRLFSARRSESGAPALSIEFTQGSRP
jgi:hypothetical protein